MSGGSDKKHAPSGQKLSKARKEGNVARSADFGAWIGIAACVVTFPMMLAMLNESLPAFMRANLKIISEDPNPRRAIEMLASACFSAAWAITPVLGAAVVAAIVATAIQGNIVVGTTAAKPKFQQLNPINGFKQLFSKQKIWEAFKQMLKTIIIGWLLWRVAERVLTQVVSAGIVDLSEIVMLVREATVEIIRTAVVIGLVIAVADYFINKRHIFNQLKMTDEEVKQEHKQSEGDPLLKGAIKSKQMQMSRNRMMAAVADADVVMVNPTHIAIALQYDPEKGAPEVVAKGQGLIATKIRELATDAKVPIVQDIPLARALYHSCEVGHFVPPDLYNAVATVFAFVMRLQSRSFGAEPQRVPGGVPEVPEPRRVRT